VYAAGAAELPVSERSCLNGTGGVLLLDRRLSLAVQGRAQVLAEEGHDVVLEAIGDCAGVGSVIDLEAIDDAVAVEDIVQLGGIEAQAVLIATSMEMAVYCFRLPMY
jgi:hypothetical protein